MFLLVFLLSLRFSTEKEYLCVFDIGYFASGQRLPYVKLSNSLDLINPSSLLLGSIGS